MRLIPRTRGGSLLRFFIGSLLVVLCAAGATAVAGLLQFKQIAQELSATPGLHIPGIKIPAPGSPQTILLIGSDHRAGEAYQSANTDTMLLMRLNPASTTINVLSIPRDLQVQIPQAGTSFTGKLNAAYSVGGPNELLNILKTEVFANQGFHVSHVIDINFQGFSDIIDAIGCVYADVDHRYYNDTALTDYSSINIQPGYQRLCGDNQADTGALAFVRFRHTDSDIVRNARQQDFIRWAKQNYTGAQLFENRSRLISIFGHHAQTDNTLHSSDAIENLLLLLVNSAGHQLKSIPFPAQLSVCNPGGETPCYVTATPQGEAAAYRAFMTPTKPVAASPTAASAAHHRAKHHASPTAGLVPDVQDGQMQAEALGRSGLPVYYPKYVVGPVANASTVPAVYCSSITGNCDDGSEPSLEYIHSYPRQYVIHGNGKAVYKSYVITAEINSELGQYYTIQGTRWTDPPILRSPSQVQTIDGKKLFEYFNGTGKLSIVAWHTPQAVYWVSNTLTDLIPPAQMKALAASLTPLGK